MQICRNSNQRSIYRVSNRVKEIEPQNPCWGVPGLKAIPSFFGDFPFVLNLGLLHDSDQILYFHPVIKIRSPCHAANFFFGLKHWTIRVCPSLHVAPHEGRQVTVLLQVHQGVKGHVHPGVHKTDLTLQGLRHLCCLRSTR